MSSQEIRQPVVAGAFYDSRPEALRESLTGFINSVNPAEINSRIIGLISPHAGYIYSGKTAAYGYKLLEGRKYDTVVVVSPSHQEYFDGVSIYPGEAYYTPLGLIKIEKNIRDEIIENNGFVVSSRTGHRKEHALEVQLPFLQHILGDFNLVPIVVGDQREEIVLSLGETLGAVLKGKNVLLIASSDLSHYYNKKIADGMDSLIEKHINNYDYKSLLEDLQKRKAEACGGGPMATVMAAAKMLGAANSKVIFRNDSSDVSQDKSEVVGYLSAVLYE